MISPGIEVAPPMVTVVTGTHSAAKTTVVNSFKQGELSDLCVSTLDGNYNDFGFGVIAGSEDKSDSPVIIVPEAASWLANLYDDPELLGTKYSLEFQLSIDVHAIFRIDSARKMVKQVTQSMIQEGLLVANDIVKPVLLCDRGPLEGVAYSRGRLPDQNTDIITDYERALFLAQWTKQHVDLAIISNHMDVPFKPHTSRHHDPIFRNNMAASIATLYRETLPPDALAQVDGPPEQRTAQTADLIRSKLNPVAT